MTLTQTTHSLSKVSSFTTSRITCDRHMNVWGRTLNMYWFCLEDRDDSSDSFTDSSLGIQLGLERRVIGDKILQQEIQHGKDRLTLPLIVLRQCHYIRDTPGRLRVRLDWRQSRRVLECYWEFILHFGHNGKITRFMQKINMMITPLI